MAASRGNTLAISMILTGLGTTLMVGAISGNLAPMLAALFDPSVLIKRPKGYNNQATVGGNNPSTGTFSGGSSGSGTSGGGAPISPSSPPAIEPPVIETLPPAILGNTYTNAPSISTVGLV